MKKLTDSKLFFLFVGIFIGILLTVIVVFFALLSKAIVPQNQTIDNSTEITEQEQTKEDTTKPTGDTQDELLATDTWSADTVYSGGETISYKGKMYKARWWTQGDAPDGATGGAWEDMMTVDPNQDPKAPQNITAVPIDTKTPKDTAITDFKVVAYYPSWVPEKLDRIDYNVITHVIYAFGIPQNDGSLLPLESPETAKKIIETAHKNGAKVLIAIGGWSYREVPLEPMFVSATDSPEKIKKFGDAILKMCNDYGFDGVDMDWEHPRVDGASAKQYEDLMVYLSEKLHADGKLLTSAVLSGVTPDGNVYYDSAAHTNAVLNAVDWINVMAYDGGDGERHSGYDFAVNCGKYWQTTRGLPAHKVVLGVPFYARPSWAAYSNILDAVPDADKKDVADFNGMQAHYNGVDTIKKKTNHAKENLGGIMIWEITQDTTKKDKSLLQAIGEASK